MLDEEGNEIKIRGKKNLKPYFNDNLPLWRKLYDSVYEKIGEKNDPNIIAFMKLLDLNKDSANAFDELNLNDSNIGEM